MPLKVTDPVGPGASAPVVPKVPFQFFPTVRYHKTIGATVIENQESLDALNLGPEWSTEPYPTDTADAEQPPTPAPVPSPTETEPEKLGD